MSRERITTSGEDAAVRLSGEILEDLGMAIGDEVELLIVERTLVLRPLSEIERAEKIDTATENVIERRKSTSEELARGAD